MHYIIGIRNSGDASTIIAFNWELYLENTSDLFDREKVSALVNRIPEAERYNIYFTANHSHPVKTRDFIENTCTWFDIDGIDREHAEKVARVAAKAVGAQYDKTGVVFTGNGVHLYIGREFPIRDSSYFNKTKAQYMALCQRINEELSKAQLRGEADGVVWERKRLLRLPLTENRKRDPWVMAEIINSSFEVQDWDLVKASGIEVETEVSEDSDEGGFKFFGRVDTEGVLSGCEFLKHCYHNQETIKEPEWYAALSVLGRLDDGVKLAHAYSNKHPNYTFDRTDSKLQQAMQSAGPRTCKNINNLWGNCKACPNYGLVKSPISIKSESFIESKDSGYRVLTDKGVRGRPHYEDLLKEFGKDFTFTTVNEGRTLMVYQTTHWEEMSDLAVQSWVTHKLVPMASATEAVEFRDRVKNQKVITIDEMNLQGDGFINFRNGVLRVETLELLPHDPKYMFKYCLDHDYDPTAECPTWDKFMLEVFDDMEVVDMMNEYIGYCFSGDRPWIQKCVAMIGSGSNGKSTIISTMENVVGSNNMASIPIDSLSNLNTRAKIMHKLFIFSEETSSRALHDNEETLKTLVSGGTLEVKKLYKDVIDYKPRAKLLISANQDLTSNDRSYGLFRRLIFVPMHKRFVIGKNADVKLEDKLKLEASGIFNRCIMAYKKTIERGRLNVPERILEVINQWQKDNDPVQQFLEDRVDITGDKNDGVKKSDLYVHYDSYCRANGFKAMNNLNFGKNLARILGDITKVIDGVRYYSKIKMKEGDDNG